MRRSSRLGSPGRHGRGWSVARQLLAMQLAVVTVLVLRGAILAYLDAAAGVERKAAEEAVTVAVTLADSADVRKVVQPPKPSSLRQPFAERVDDDAGIWFIAIVDRD